MNLGICLYFWHRTLWDSRAQQWLFHTVHNSLPTAMSWRQLRRRQEQDYRARGFPCPSQPTDPWLTGVFLSSKYLVTLTMSFSLMHLSVSYTVLSHSLKSFSLSNLPDSLVFFHKSFLFPLLLFLCSSEAHNLWLLHWRALPTPSGVHCRTQ